MATKKGGRERLLRDEEIGLIKAMLAKGMKNDEVHFYFNRADRLISPGRISQIKSGAYGASIAVATSSELDAFLGQWRASHLLATRDDPTSPTDADVISAMFIKVSGSWALRSGETDRAESKKAFRLTPDYRFADCIKTIAGFANNRGGYLLFGIDDDTQFAVGLEEHTFADTDPAAINRCLASALAPVPHVTKTVVEVGGKTIGILHVEPHAHAPVMAVKNIGSGDVKEGAIYFRYVGETRQIQPAELQRIVSNREQQAVAEFARRMGQVATGKAATLDLDTGQVSGKTGSFLIGKDLLPTIQFIREGDFTEVKGAPALRLIGDVEPVSEEAKERARIIRDNVTPDAVIRNFLRDERVLDPMQYIHAQAHCQRKWLPVWHYVRMTGLPTEAIIADLRAQVPSHPSSRNSVVQRLLGREGAFKIHPGKPARMCEKIVQGELTEPASPADIVPFANAIMGLPDDAKDAARLKVVLLQCLDHVKEDSGRRSAVYRAACRLDELLQWASGRAAP